ncbi:hypothetical protein [Streptomyces fagopyri]|uniref:hypothetical protein n=1 Tax=Streptomyces fagopyri TaxID=2662397 RepID=UPI003805CEFD
METVTGAALLLRRGFPLAVFVVVTSVVVTAVAVAQEARLSPLFVLSLAVSLDTVVLPSAMILLGRANWWAPRIVARRPEATTAPADHHPAPA